MKEAEQGVFRLVASQQCFLSSCFIGTPEQAPFKLKLTHSLEPLGLLKPSPPAPRSRCLSEISWSEGSSLSPHRGVSYLLAANQILSTGSCGGTHKPWPTQHGACSSHPENPAPPQNQQDAQ